MIVHGVTIDVFNIICIAILYFIFYKSFIYLKYSRLTKKKIAVLFHKKKQNDENIFN